MNEIFYYYIQLDDRFFFNSIRMFPFHSHNLLFVHFYNEHMSYMSDVTCGVLQGSVLGPLLFIYT